MKKVIFDGEEFHEIPGFQGYFVSTGLKVIKDTSDGTVKMISTDDISRMNLEKAKEAMKRIREEVTPTKALTELRKMEKLFSTLIEGNDPKPIMKYLEHIRDNKVIPYLIKRDYGRFRATELAEEAMMETITAILKGHLPINIPGYMKTVAKSLYKRQRMALQTQFAELYPGTEYDSAKDELENYYSMLYQ